MNASHPAPSLPSDFASPTSSTRVLLDCMTEGVSLSREDGIIVYTNPAEDRLFGYAPGELIGRHVSIQNAYAVEENERIVAAVIAELRTSGAWQGEWENRRKDGSVFATRSRISALELEGRRYWLCVQENVTEERETAKALHEERARLKLATEAAEIGIWDQDVLSGRMTYSPRAKAIFDLLPSEEVTGHRILSVIHPDDRAHVEALSRAAIDPQVRGRDPYEYRVIRKDGSIRWVLGRGEAIFEGGDGEIRAVRYLGTLQDITSRRALEEAERGAAQQLRLALAAGQMAVWDLDIATNTVTGSSRLYRLLGFPEGQPIDVEAAHARYAPGERERVSAEGEAALARGETSNDAEFSYLHPEAGARWLRLRYEVLFDEASVPVRVIGVMSDETERKQAETQVRASEARLRAALEIETVGAIHFDMEGRLTDANEAFLRLSGYGREDLDAGLLTWQGLTPREWKEDSERAFAELKAKGETTPYEKEYVRKDGSRWWALFAAKLLPDGTGFEFVLDITDRKTAEAALLEETRTLETLSRTGAAVAGELGLEPLVQMITDAGVDLTGAQFCAYLHNEMDETGERLHLFTLSGAERDQFISMGRPRATGVFGPTFRNEGVVRSGDIMADPRYGRLAPHHGMPKGHLPVRSYLAVSVVSRSDGVLGGLLFGHPEPDRFTERHERLIVGLAAQAAIAIDNARLFQAAQSANEALESRVAERTAELTQAHEALRQAQKMEAVGQLTGGIAHDFNNLLAGISGSLEAIERRLAQGRLEGLDRFIKGALSSSQRAAALTQRLLAFSRRQTLDPKPTDVNRLVLGMEELIRRTTGPGIEVEVVGAGGLWSALIDAAQLESALLNLAINARDAMPEGGRLTIETANKWLDERAARERELPVGQYLSICVTDTGTGMPQHVIDRIFDPFFTTKPIGQGTGLGLSMVHGFMRQSGGQVRVYSEPGEGTTMCLYLPRYHGTLSKDAEDEPPAIGELGTGETILVIDDEPTVRMLIVEVLEEAGYTALEADDGPSGLRILGSDTRISLLITDVGLPGGMNGRQVADAARSMRPGLKVLFVTGFAENAAVGNGHLEPGMEVITKPFAMADLASKISEMIEA